MYRIRLSDGTELSELEISGNNFVSTRELTAKDFAGKLGRVLISSDGEDELGLVGEHENMKLVQVMEYEIEPGRWYFILSDMSESELRELRIDSRLDYIEMMEGLE